MAWSAGGVTESHVIFARWRWWCWSWLWLAWRQHAQVYLKYSVLLSVSAAVWAAALSGQQPGPGSGVSPLQLRRRGRVYTCPHCRLYSRPRRHCTVAYPNTTLGGWLGLFTHPGRTCPRSPQLRPSIGQPLSETDCRPTLSPSGGRGHPQVKLLLLLASPHNGTGGGDV